MRPCKWHCPRISGTAVFWFHAPHRFISLSQAWPGFVGLVWACPSCLLFLDSWLLPDPSLLCRPLWYSRCLGWQSGLLSLRPGPSFASWRGLTLALSCHTASLFPHLCFCSFCVFLGLGSIYIWPGVVDTLICSYVSRFCCITAVLVFANILFSNRCFCFSRFPILWVVGLFKMSVSVGDVFCFVCAKSCVVGFYL